ncbi:MAG: hypothetical protein M0008_03040 [Actinomycetota bacterium]|nr:hypothetical protein [Actinomycetota bacterium]
MSKGIQVTTSGGVTIVRVCAWRLGNIQVDSHDAYETATKPQWPKATRDAISARLSEEGARKGRILYAQVVSFPREILDPVAALTLHLDADCVRVLHIGHVTTVATVAQQDAATSALITCAEKMAGIHGCKRVELLLHRQPDIRRYRQFGFKQVGRSDHRYEGLHRNDYLLERQRNSI